MNLLHLSRQHPSRTLSWALTGLVGKDTRVPSETSREGRKASNHQSYDQLQLGSFCGSGKLSYLKGEPTRARVFCLYANHVLLGWGSRQCIPFSHQSLKFVGPSVQVLDQWCLFDDINSNSGGRSKVSTPFDLWSLWILSYSLIPMRKTMKKGGLDRVYQAQGERKE